MSDTPSWQPPPPPGGPPLRVLPVREPYAPRPSVVGGLFRWLFRTAFAISVGLNLFLLLMVASLGGGLGDGFGQLNTRFYSGKRTATDKIAIIRMDGVIMEGMTAYTQKQIDEAAADDSVKAVVLRINSPGGSITASDDLYKRLCELRDGTSPRTDTDGKNNPKPIVVSMGALAASGGYYIAVPAPYVMAEETTITGSIGVYAAFPNIAKFADDHGLSMEVVKRGEVKNSGSMFHKMDPLERQVWQDMVDQAYGRFIQVVETGRPALKGKMTKDVINKEVKAEDGKTVHYVRKRADGGIFTSQQAKEFGLIDGIGYLEDALVKAQELASLGDYKAVTYDRPQSFMNAFLGADAKSALPQLDLGKLSSGVMPRLWYLAPQSELAGFLAAAGRE